MSRTLSRDPFSRTETVRTVAHRKGSTYRTCDWCGRNNGDATLYRYRVAQDGLLSRPFRLSGAVFCSHDCCKSYND